MFRQRRAGHFAAVGVTGDCRTVWVRAGASAAAAVFVAGFSSIRETPAEGSARAPYCMMGVCFDCLAEIDGVPNRQSCMVEARPGVKIRRPTPTPPLDTTLRASLPQPSA